MHTDPIADILNRIKNAHAAGLENCSAPYSKKKEEILKLLKAKSYINNYEVKKDELFRRLSIDLNVSLPNLNIKRISKPGRRVYVKSSDIKKVQNGLGMAIISTSKGLMPGETAYKEKLGGEYVCEVY